MFTPEQVQDIRAAIKYYVSHHISINNPRHEEFTLILNQLENIDENLSGYCERRLSAEALPYWISGWDYDESDANTQVGG